MQTHVICFTHVPDMNADYIQGDPKSESMRSSMDASSASCSSRAVLPSQTEKVQQWPSHFCNTRLPTMRIQPYTHQL